MMSNDYLRRENIREVYIDAMTDHLSSRLMIERISAEAEAEFNEMIRQECEAAWDESASAHRQGIVTHEWHVWPKNPYTPND